MGALYTNIFGKIEKLHINESEFIDKVEEGKEYKIEILKELIFRNQCYFYSKTIRRNYIIEWEVEKIEYIYF